MLPSEKNNERTRRDVIRAARARFGRVADINTVFEHGHWWITLRTVETDIIYSVVDTQNGFDFEEV